MSSSEAGTWHRCGRELKGAIETHRVSVGAFVCIAVSIETPECNWTRCRICQKAVCKSCHLPVAAMCSHCYVVQLHANGTAAAASHRNGEEGPPEPIPFRRKAA